MFGLLRTILAIYVVLLHVFSFPTLGNYAVSFFFILSGFLMTYIMQETYHYNPNGIRLFWKNRFLRLYPTYWIILILSLLVLLFLDARVLNPSMFFPSSIKEWFSNISMIFFDIVPHRVKPRVVPTSWALTNELIFYFLISLGISKTLKRTLFWLFLSILYYVATYLVYDIATFRYSAIPASSLPFAIGAILFWINQEHKSTRESLFLILFLFLLFNFNAIYLANTGNVFFNEVSIYANQCIAAVLVLLLFNFKTTKKIKKIDNYIGYFSYPIYLSHYLICGVYIYFFGTTNFKQNYKLETDAMLGYFIILLAFCFVLVHLIDKPIDKFKKKLLK